MSQCKWYLLMKVEQIEGTTGQSAHFQFLPTSYAPKTIEEDGYQILAGFNQEPEEKSFTVTLRDPRPPCPIDWRVVPKNWVYAAMDSDGTWWLYDEKPMSGKYGWDVDPGNYDVEEIDLKTEGIHWRDSLYERPEV